MYKSFIFIQLFLFFSIISFSDGSFFDSLVNIKREDNGDKKVGVHLPFIYWMDLNRNNEGQKLDLSVLSGFVKVNVDRKKVNGQRPVMVRIFGQNVYNSYPKDYAQTNANSYQSSAHGAETNEVVSVKPTNYEKPDKVPESATETIKAFESSKVYNTTELPSPPEAN